MIKIEYQSGQEGEVLSIDLDSIEEAPNDLLFNGVKYVRKSSPSSDFRFLRAENNEYHEALISAQENLQKMSELLRASYGRLAVLDDTLAETKQIVDEVL